ncbi:hypothetical protein AAFF_G00341040 [Aldrovandia affinis]|uniref:Uncharacterized protein n=1 Tax=Aldrovandia affinis TaxID=143900 RepID=A0AAD7SMQ1_9TELE|nr:hypothetical protein AAFF_G00341040 [Aldrovandia affinis]
MATAARLPAEFPRRQREPAEVGAALAPAPSSLALPRRAQLPLRESSGEEHVTESVARRLPDCPTIRRDEANDPLPLCAGFFPPLRPPRRVFSPERVSLASFTPDLLGTARFQSPLPPPPPLARPMGPPRNCIFPLGWGDA